LQIKFKNELLVINIIVALFIVVISFFPSNIVRIILGLPLILFFPGYTFVAALFPRKDTLDGINRVALSFGLSITMVPIIGLILNYTPWGVRLYPFIICLVIFVVTTSLVAWQRRRRWAEVERFTISLNFSLPPWRGQGFMDKTLSVILIVAILGAIGTVGYAIATPKVGERFTEFYILGLEGKAGMYAEEVAVGERTVVIVGIVNHEHETESYRLEVRIDGMKNNEIGPIVLGHEQKWEKRVGFTLERAVDNQKVEFLLYKDEGDETYRMLHLWVNVKE